MDPRVIILRVVALLEITVACIFLVISIQWGRFSYHHWGAGRSVLKGMNLMELGEYPAAREQFQDAVKDLSGYEAAYEALLHLAMNSNPPDEKAANESANYILILTKSKGTKASGAYIAYGVMKCRQAAAAQDPAQRTKLLDDGELQFNKAQKADPDNADPWINLALLEFLRKETPGAGDGQANLQRASDALTKAKNSRTLAVHGLYPMTAALGRLLFERNEHNRALEEMSKSAELDPKGVEGLTNYGVAFGLRLRSTGLTEDQKRALIQKAEKLIPNTNPSYYFLMNSVGNVYFELDRLEEAKGVFLQLASDFKKSGTGFANVGSLRYFRFMRAANRTILDEPISDTFNNLYMAHENGDLPPRDDAWCLNLMALCRLWGYPFPTTPDPKPVESPEYYLRKSIEADPTFWLASRNLGVLHQKKKEWKEAFAYYKMAINSNPAQEDIMKAIRLLQDPPEVSTPQLYPPTVTTDADEMGITQLEMPAMILTIKPSYPGTVDMNSTKITIDNTPQRYWEFLTDNHLLLVAQEPLSDGRHTFKGEFTDAGGNLRNITWEFAVDLNPPTAKFSKPAKDEAVDSKTVFNLELTDGASRVEFSSLNLQLISSGGSTSANAEVIKKGAFQYDMFPLNQFKAQKIKDSPVQFTLPANFTADGDLNVLIEFRDRAGRSSKVKEQFRLAKSKKP